MRKLIIVALVALFSSCGADRTKVELTNGNGDKIEVSTLGMKDSDYDYDQFVKMAKKVSSNAKGKCSNPSTYAPGFVSISDWERNTKDFPDEYESKNEIVSIMHSFKASNAYGVAGSNTTNGYFEKVGENYEDITEKVNKARYGDLVDEMNL
jgi:hypothetical protein